MKRVTVDIGAASCLRDDPATPTLAPARWPITIGSPPQHDQANVAMSSNLEASGNSTDQTARLWTLDPERSTVEFSVRHFWGLITVQGHFERFSGSYLAGDTPTVELTVDSDSLTTGNKQRDKHLRSADFFDVLTHPKVTFTSRAITVGNATLTVEGDLEAAGKVEPLSFKANIREMGDELEIDATTTVDQRLFGMTWSPLGTTRPPATLHVKAMLR